MEYKAMYSQERSVLKDHIPLESPYVIHLELTSFCNIRCEYCIHSLGREGMLQKGHVFGTMNDDTLERVYDSLRTFNVPVKKVVLGGIGEPTLYKNLAKVVLRIKESSPSTKVGLITNGILLSNELSDKLIAAGLDEVKISLQGLSDDDYFAHCGVKIDFNSYLSNLQYFFEHKGQNTKLYVKIPSDYLITKTEQQYYELFKGRCDYASIENLTNCFELERTNMQNLSLSADRFNLGSGHTVSVCAIPFYRLDVLCNGDISLCNAARNVGFIINETICKKLLIDIWNGITRKNFLLSVLRGASGDIPPICSKCFCRTSFAFQEDYLDDYAEEIYRRICQNG
jgi:uncharacterized Fe-S cluster-containing radical SAM superfamily protein